MSLEQQIASLIEALDRNTAALGGAAGGEATSGKAAAGKPAAGKGKGASKPEFDEETVKAMAVRIKDEFGTGEAKKLIKSAGKADQLADIKPANYKAFMEACQAKLDEAENGDGDGGDGDGL